jgi:very-short-patch-repair endonuclease
MANDADIVRLAELRTHLATVHDLRRLGLTHRQIRYRIAHERLFVVYPGVVSTVPPPFDFMARARSACLAVPEGVLSFSTAAYLHRIRRAPGRWLDMTIPARRVGRLPEIHFHRSNLLPGCDVAQTIDGLRLTTPARTLFDLASILDGPALRSAVEDARNRGLVSDLDLEAVAARLIGQGRPGSVMFRSVVEPLRGQAPAGSHYELVVRDALREAGLDPIPQHRVRLPNGNTAYFDLALVESRLDIEIDPAVTHSGPGAVAADKARDVQVTLAGWMPVRFTDQDVERRLRNIVGYVRALHHRRTAA